MIRNKLGRLWTWLKDLGTVERLSPIYSSSDRPIDVVETHNVVTMSKEQIERCKEPKWITEMRELYHAEVRREEFQTWIKGCKELSKHYGWRFA